MTKSKVKLYQHDLPLEHGLHGNLAIDTEAMGLNYVRDRLCLIQICDEHGNICIVQFNSNFDAPILKQLLSDNNRIMIMHYARFDMMMIKYYLQVDIQNIFCTKIASKLVRTYTDSHGLKELCRELLGKLISKQQQSSDWGRSDLSVEQIEYASSDVIYLHALQSKLEKMLFRENRMELAQKCFSFLQTRISLDLEGFENIDIFAHR